MSFYTKVPCLSCLPTYTFGFYLYIYIYYILDPCLGRKWKYNEDVEEFFVEDETTVKLKRADLTRQVDTTEMDDRVLVIELFF